MARTRTQKDREKNAAGMRKSYATLKRGLLLGITTRLGIGYPRCTMVQGGHVCGRSELESGYPLEIEHVHFTRFRQRRMGSVQRLERFAAEFVRWMGGDESRALAIACRSCNAAKQPPKK